MALWKPKRELLRLAKPFIIRASDGMPGMPNPLHQLLPLPGSADYQTPGTYQFTTVPYLTSFTLQLWGGSGGGSGFIPFSESGDVSRTLRGGSGTLSQVTFGNGLPALVANPGTGGYGTTNMVGHQGQQGEGGTAAGGTQVNQAGNGGAFTYAGAGNAFGWCQGGQGGGYSNQGYQFNAGGGGAGAYVQSTFNFAQLPDLVVITIVVGSGGTATQGGGASSQNRIATAGNGGRAILTWS